MRVTRVMIFTSATRVAEKSSSCQGWHHSTSTMREPCIHPTASLEKAFRRRRRRDRLRLDASRTAEVGLIQVPFAHECLLLRGRNNPIRYASFSTSVAPPLLHGNEVIAQTTPGGDGRGKQTDAHSPELPIISDTSGFRRCSASV